jgi:hypothetical protein
MFINQLCHFVSQARKLNLFTDIAKDEQPRADVDARAS